MAEKEIIFETAENAGEIKISGDVILSIAAQALAEIKGISLMASAAESIMDKLVKKATTGGVKIYLGEEEKVVDIDVHVALNYGINIPEISWEIQDAVKKNVEAMTDITVNKVNVFVDGLVIEKEPKPAKPKKEKKAKDTEEQDAAEAENK